MIGVLAKPDQIPVVEEFFELFKTPWEFCRHGRRYDVVIATVDDVPEVEARLILVSGAGAKNTDAADGIFGRPSQSGAGVEYHGTALPIYGRLSTFGDGDTAVLVVARRGGTAIRLGYDLFEEVRILLTAGQPAERAHLPTLDLHIALLREWILGAGRPLLEIPPVPAHYAFIACLTHDIDFVAIRHHRFDHTMWGFLYRSTIGALHSCLRRRISIARLVRLWGAAASLPFVYLGWMKDLWEPFDWYLRVENGLPATYFLIPFKRRPGDHVPGRHPSRRATRYDVADVAHRTGTLIEKGCELGVHGIDAWHCPAKGRDELARLAAVASQTDTGIRMHWLLGDAKTPRVLEQAGYAYDSSVGFNETIGYRAGTAQVYRPPGARALLELPMIIQDGAMFYPRRLDLSEAEAERRCGEMIAGATRFGGALTVLWHDRSHAPERLWGDFYVRLIDTLKTSNAWFGTASQVVGWFRRRREVRFETADAVQHGGACVRPTDEAIRPPVRIRVHQNRSRFVDIPWNGTSAIDVDAYLQEAVAFGPAAAELCSLS